MSRLEELIDKLCPNGVEYITLSDICDVYDGTHQTPQYTDSGIRFVSVENINALYDTQKYISVDAFEKYKIKPQKNDVLMTRIGSIGTCAVVDRDEPLAYYVSLALLRPNLSKINSYYLKYVIESKQGRKELRKRTLVNAVPIKVNMGEIGKIKIPVPPIEVQKEIVSILDVFEIYIKKLSKEFELREKQSNYYIAELLSFDKSTPKIKLDDCCILEKGKTPIQKAVAGEYPLVVTTEERKSSNTYQFNSKTVCIPLVSSRGHGVACLNRVYYQEGKFALGNILCGVTPNNYDELSAEYLYYYLNFKKDILLVPLMKGGANVSLTVDALRGVKIPVPTIKEQNDILSKLKPFAEYQETLKKEINARQIQYEYYKDKLLSFKQLSE